MLSDQNCVVTPSNVHAPALGVLIWPFQMGVTVRQQSNVSAAADERRPLSACCTRLPRSPEGPRRTSTWLGPVGVRPTAGGHEEALGAWEASETATVADASASELAVSSRRHCSDLKEKYYL